jgi:hypothetical protein
MGNRSGTNRTDEIAKVPWIPARDARRSKDKQAVDDRGGVDALDNKRNEVAPKKWPSMGVTPP